jgi:hypothetical protein
VFIVIVFHYYAGVFSSFDIRAEAREDHGKEGCVEFATVSSRVE